MPCSYICRIPRGIWEHCEQWHGWVYSQKRDGDTRSKRTHAKNKTWSENHACQRLFKVVLPNPDFEVAREQIAEHPERQASRKYYFFQAQEDDIQAAEREAAAVGDQVQDFSKHVSAVVPWLRETGIADHIYSLRKDEIRTAIAVPPLGDESDLRTIVDAMEALLRDAHRLCFDGPGCMLTYQCRVVLSRFQPSQVDLSGKTRPFDPHKEAKSLIAYFGIALRLLSYFSRLLASNEYHFSSAADANDNVAAQRPEACRGNRRSASSMARGLRPITPIPCEESRRR